MSDQPLRTIERPDGLVVEQWLMMFGQMRTVVYRKEDYPLLSAAT